MRRFNTQRRLAPFLNLAALVALSFPAHAQIAAPAAAQPPSSTVGAPQPQPTPEELGDTLMRQKRYQAAIEAFKETPLDSAIVWNKMGIANQMMFNLSEAARCYQASLKINPRDAHVLNNLGTVYDSVKQYGAAARIYRRALKLDSNSAILEKNLGTSLLAQRQYKKGWEAYQAALALDPDIFGRHSGPKSDNPASIQERGAMNYYQAKGCVLAGQNDQAIEYLGMALDEGFTNAKKVAADREFASLRGTPAFEQLLAAQRNP